MVLASSVAAGCGDDTSGDGGSGDSGTQGTSGGATPGDDGGEMGTPATDEGSTGGGNTAVDSSGGSDAAETDDSTGSTGGPDGPDVDLTDPQLYEFELDPLELDPTVVENIALQYAHLDTRVQPRGKLVFFLSGFTNTPAAWRNHGRQLAGYGFHVVEPHYDNDWSCGGMGGSCSTDTRWEALVGEDISPVIVTSRADSAEGRVVTMLQHLIEAHPGGDWGYYLNDDDSLRYEDVIIAGISHGASSTGLFATRRPFHRAVMHSGGWWDTTDSMTPVDLFFGLTHSDDEQHDGHLSAWEAAGMPGVPTVIEDGAPPYGSNQLIATTPNGYPHCSVVVHGESPLDGEDYVFDPAWRYMYGADPL